MKRTSACLGAVVVAAVGASSAQPRGPVEPSPVTEADVARIVLESGGDEAEIRQSIREGRLTDVYFDDDFRRLFPEIGADEARAFHCQRAFSTTLAFVAPSTDNEVRVNQLECSYRDGLFCSLYSSEAFYSSDPSAYFTSNGLPLEEALEVLELRGDTDSDWPVSAIRKSGNSYVLTLGRPGCACIGETTVEKRTFLWFSWLVTLVPPQTTCV